MLRYLVFLLLFAVLFTATCYWFLIPAFEVAGKADPEHRKLLAAHAMLLLVSLLTILGLSLLALFRLRRFFFPPSDTGRTRTKYTDAWTESGRRLIEKLDSEANDDDDADDDIPQSPTRN